MGIANELAQGFTLITADQLRLRLSVETLAEEEFEKIIRPPHLGCEHAD